MDKRTTERGSTALGVYIQRQLQQRGWEQRDLSTAMGLSEGSISRIISGYVRRPSVETLALMADALDVPITILLDKAGYQLPPATALSSVEAELVAQVRQHPQLRDLMPDFLALSPEQQQTMRAVIAALAQQNAPPSQE